MIRKLKRAVRTAIEAQGYVVRPTTEFGISLGNDLRRLIRNPEQPRIIDVGANAGQWLASVKRTFPDARVICYEPDLRAFTQLQTNAQSFTAVECVHCALGDAPGRTKFFRNADSVTSSLLKTVTQERPLPYAEKTKAVDAVEIDVRKLSDEFARLGIDHVDLLKTDCQGFDLRVLEGAAYQIENGHVDLIATEALFQFEYEGQAWFHEVLAWLSARRFSLIGIYDVLHDETGRALFGDALFRRTI